MNNVQYYNPIQNYQQNTIQNNNTYVLVSQIGQQTRFSNIPRIQSEFNIGLINKLTSIGAETIPYLINLLNTTTRDTVIAEGAFLAQELAKRKTRGYEQLYAPLARHANHPCPVVQVMIAGAFRDIAEPSAAGPLTRMLFNDLRYPRNAFTFDPTEEIAGSIIELIAQRAATNISRKMEPRLQQIESKLNITA